MTDSPTCNTPDSTRPTTFTTFALESFERSVIEIRNGRSRDREGTSIVSGYQIDYFVVTIPRHSRRVGPVYHINDFSRDGEVRLTPLSPLHGMKNMLGGK